MGEALSSLEAQYLFLTQHLADILDACQTDDQRNQVRTSYVTARRNYWDAINQIFHDDDPKIEQAVARMKDTQVSLEKMTEDLANIAKVIAAITAAVKVGSELAAMAG
jgi:predicted phage tail protein